MVFQCPSGRVPRGENARLGRGNEDEAVIVWRQEIEPAFLDSCRVAGEVPLRDRSAGPRPIEPAEDHWIRILEFLVGESDLESSDAKINEKTGKLSWELELEPNEKKVLTFQYSVKYPGNVRIILE